MNISHDAVFLDTVGLIAVWDTTDQWHAPAAAVYAELVRNKRVLVTTSLVLLECGNAAARRTYRTDVCDLRVSLLAENLLIEPTAQEIDTAWANFSRGEAAQAGIADHISFLIMRRLKLTDAFTNDRHFQAAGFNVLF